MTAGTSEAARPDVLRAILGATRRTVEIRKASRRTADLERDALKHEPAGRAFAAGLRQPDRFNVIAECKRRSPSRGVLRARYDPAALARGYEAAGAVAISVLTEPSFFDGALEHLAQVRGAVRCPILRKDFLIDEYQLLEARVAGADAVLLIVAALEQAELTRLHGAATAHGFAVLVEAHTRDELDRAIQAGATIVGINSRNLRTLEVSLDGALDLARHLLPGVTAVAESGIRSWLDLAALRAGGYHAFLVGERLMTAPDPGAALAALLKPVPA
jgi:indole-3-glycerol phosphate synthase